MTLSFSESCEREVRTRSAIVSAKWVCEVSSQHNATLTSFLSFLTSFSTPLSDSSSSLILFLSANRFSCSLASFHARETSPPLGPNNVVSTGSLSRAFSLSFDEACSERFGNEEDVGRAKWTWWSCRLLERRCEEEAEEGSATLRLPLRDRSPVEVDEDALGACDEEGGDTTVVT